ncbi:uncharacterized protein KIAA1671 homolog [Clupea harengus]|uniref:Uncharacterized protein KIAA1671 homolog n=1 Tax=Clupea harengus TaxID=7950 RepID=A0A8M1KE65_CLUHA|nr:uncharacterized protein KIAA1671 homolog [Clupea harengus]
MSLLDSSAMRLRVQLGKKRNRRAPPSRVASHSALLSVLPENQYKDSTEEKGEPCEQEDPDSEEKLRGAPSSSSSSSSSQPQRVALFPGMDPSALKAQLKKRSDSDSPPEGTVAPSPSQLSLSPKSPFLLECCPHPLQAKRMASDLKQYESATTS